MKAQSFFVRSVTYLLLPAVLALSGTPDARAAMVTTGSFMAQQTPATPRDRLLLLLQKEAVQKKLQEYGVSPAEAKSRLASLSDQEIAKLNAKIDKLPAGADTAEAILGTALVVFIVLLLTDILCVTKVFKFTRCAN